MTAWWYNVAGVVLPFLTLAASAGTHYVDLNDPAPVSPYISWSNAATTIQDAADAASGGDTVLVTNGTYSTGGRAVTGTMANRVAVDKPLTLRSVNGPQLTIIQGRHRRASRENLAPAPLSRKAGSSSS